MIWKYAVRVLLMVGYLLVGGTRVGAQLPVREAITAQRSLNWCKNTASYFSLFLVSFIGAHLLLSLLPWQAMEGMSGCAWSNDSMIPTHQTLQASIVPPMMYRWPVLGRLLGLHRVSQGMTFWSKCLASSC